jgi:uncharacterized membrane protein
MEAFMTTPLLMIFILVLPMVIAALPWPIRHRNYRRAAAAIGLGLVFLFTASGHFVRADAMADMIPPVFPARDILVFLTGLLEIVVACGLFVPRTRRTAGVLAVAMLIAFFPFNVYAALQHVDMGGHAWGPTYLLIRTPLQAILIAWAYWFTIRSTSAAGEPVANHHARAGKTASAANHT